MAVTLREVEQTRLVDPRPISIDEVLRNAGEYISGPRRAAALKMIRAAHTLAQKCHDGQDRLSGEPFINHPLSVAALLTDMHMDEAALCAALLHDVVEDSTCDIETITDMFGAEIADLVDGVTKLTQFNLADLEDAQFRTLRKMFMAMARDIRVVLVKLADRLHNVQTAHALPEAKRNRFCQETLEIFAPLAGRLGIFEWKWQLEDGAFRHLAPNRYELLSRLLDARHEERYARVKATMNVCKEKLESAGMTAEISGRAKHIYSIDQKMRRNGVEIDQVYDLIAVRVIVETVEECYQALAMVHSEWRAISGQFDDYISAPKHNRYQSLHTAVAGPGGMPFEVQIRTEEMHSECEYGVAAHWRYKEGLFVQEDFDDKLSWIRQVLEWQEDLETAAPLVDILKGDIFSDQVFVFSPKGDVVDLPAGATPLDFAYRIHTEVGHHCIGAKVNGRLVSLEYELRNGDRVEILTSKGSRGPSRDWLTIVRTGHARDKVRQWFKRQERAENEDYGRLVLDNELRRLGHRGLARVDQKALEGVARRLSFADASGLLAAIGYGAVTATQVINRLGLDADDQAGEADEVQEIVAPEEAIGERIQPPVNVLGTGDLLTRLGNCCNPIPGDSIIGFITRGRGVTVHNSACPNVANIAEPERLVQVSWGGQVLRNSAGLPSRLAPCCMPAWGSKIVGERVGGEAVVHLASCPQVSTNGVERLNVSWGEELHTRLPVTMRITAGDREGLLRDVAGVVAEEGYSITSASVSTTSDGLALLRVNLDLANINELTRLLNRVQSIRNVMSARREAPGLRKT